MDSKIDRHAGVNVSIGSTFEGDTVAGQMPNGDWLLVAPSNKFKPFEWGCRWKLVGAAYDGGMNTDKLVAAGSPAAIYCRTGLDKAYDLPSKDDLNMLAMFHRQHTLWDADIEWEWAWSSTEGGSSRAWVQRLSDGYQGVSNKKESYWVLPVRRVSPVQVALKEAAKLREQRDELLEALELMIDTHDEGGWPTASITIARAAIAKVKECV